jgi:hypothetical protein
MAVGDGGGHDGSFWKWLCAKLRAGSRQAIKGRWVFDLGSCGAPSAKFWGWLIRAIVLNATFTGSRWVETRNRRKLSHKNHIALAEMYLGWWWIFLSLVCCESNRHFFLRQKDM